MKSIHLALSCLCLAACAPKPWLKADGSAPVHLARDESDCEFEGEKAAAPLSGGGEVVWAVTKLRVVDACMAAKGYVR
jgi:hypothetical protein